LLFPGLSPSLLSCSLPGKLLLELLIEELLDCCTSNPTTLLLSSFNSNFNLLVALLD
jgi:hypothetical protein